MSYFPRIRILDETGTLITPAKENTLIDVKFNVERNKIKMRNI